MNTICPVLLTVNAVVGVPSIAANTVPDTGSVSVRMYSFGPVISYRFTSWYVVCVPVPEPMSWSISVGAVSPSPLVVKSDQSLMRNECSAPRRASANAFNALASLLFRSSLRRLMRCWLCD